MFTRTLAAALATTAVIASTAAARPVFDQLAPANSAVPSQEKLLAVLPDSRAADDFILPLGNGRPHRVSYIQLEMIGNGVPALAKFGVTIFRNDPAVPFGRPGAVIATRLGATSIAALGPTGVPGMNKYIVTFVVSPAAPILLPANTRMWISGFGRMDDTRQWGFGRKLGGINLTPGRFNGNFSVVPTAWSMFQPYSDHAFRIVTIQP